MLKVKMILLSPMLIHGLNMVEVDTKKFKRFRIVGCVGTSSTCLRTLGTSFHILYLLKFICQSPLKLDDCSSHFNGPIFLKSEQQLIVYMGIV